MDSSPLMGTWQRGGKGQRVLETGALSHLSKMPLEAGEGGVVGVDVYITQLLESHLLQVEGVVDRFHSGQHRRTRT